MAISKLQNQPKTAAPGFPCAVCQALVELPKADAKRLLEVLSDPTWRYSTIADSIAADSDTPEWIRNIHSETYSRHARGKCAARTKLR